MKTLFILLTLIIAASLSEAATDKVFCYFASWSAYRSGINRFDVEDIDPFRCSHATYAFIGLNEDGTVNILDPENDVVRGAFTRFVNMKTKNPKLKVLISLGGWSEGSERYSRVVNDPVRRARLVNSVYDFVVEYGFDGLDFDWEYPNRRGGTPENYVTFIDFLRELRNKFGSQYLITAAVGADPDLVGSAYDVAGMNRYMDYINLMTYDFNDSSGGRTAQNTPLYASSLDINRVYNSNYTVYHWIRNGASPEKLFLGLGFYAKTYTLADSNVNGLYAPTIGAGTGGESGYRAICTRLNEGGWTVMYDYEQECPYAFKDNQWMGYDNPQSIRAKSQYAVNMNMAGVMMWAIDYDDHKNTCGTGWNPLLNAIWSVIWF